MIFQMSMTASQLGCASSYAAASQRSRQEVPKGACALPRRCVRVSGVIKRSARSPVPLLLAAAARAAHRRCRRFLVAVRHGGSTAPHLLEAGRSCATRTQAAQRQWSLAWQAAG